MKVLLLDAYNLIHRARTGFTKGDYPVIYNFFRGLRPIIEKHAPDKVYFVLEGNPSFRLELSEGNYKANRKSPGDSFHRQKAAIINLVSKCMPFIVAKHPELECDDTIATLASKHVREGDECVIVSTDSDFIQLLNCFDIEIYNPIKKSYVARPDYDYVAWKSLRGDATDNIKGIPGVGDKTAQKLIADPVLLKEFLSDTEKRETFERNVHLIRLVDFSNDLSLLEYTEGAYRPESLKDAFEELGFDSMLKDKTWKNYCETFEEIKNVLFT